MESENAVKGWRRKSRWLSYKIIASIFITGMSLATFAIILMKNYSTDLDGHIHLLELHLRNGKFPVPPLYYSGLYFLKQIFLTNYKFNTVVILSLSVLWKYNLALKYIGSYNSLLKSDRVVVLVLVSLMFFFPIYLPGIDGSKLYLGKFTPTIWHNSTAIVAFPFSLLLFFRSIKYIERPNRKDLMLIFLLSVLILITKPSFLFAFIPVFPFMYIMRKQVIDVHLFSLSIYCLIMTVGISSMAWWIYKKGQLDNLLYGGEKTEVLFAPFEVWLNWTNVPHLDLITSLLFLVLYVGFNHHTLLKDWHFGYGLSLLIAGLSMFLILAESGERFAHGNFYWQVPICLFMVYLVVVKDWLRTVEVKPSILETIKGLTERNKVLLCVFFLHVASGGIYLFKLLYFGSFS
ncbi:MAG TPA: hypothetical protein VKX40_07395 [Aequorivita sp.]|nr:hypothetical protein [Aequorivita sp.]